MKGGGARFLAWIYTFAGHNIYPWFQDSDTEDEDDPIPVKPYVNARIKQNLADINFSDHDDSDVDEEFKVR